MKLSAKYVLWCRILIFLILFCDLVSGQQAKRTADHIVQEMARQYSALSLYQDQGAIETTYLESDGERFEKIEFKIYFKRPQFFRFEWTNLPLYSTEPLKHILWCDGQRTYTYAEPDSYKENENLGMAIAGATGISGGAAHTIPRLLIKEVGGFSLTQLNDLVLVGDELMNDEDCYVIRGKHPVGSIYEIWIRKKDYVLLKLRNKKTFNNFSTIQDEIHKEIKLNQKIPSEIFKFKPSLPQKDTLSEAD